MLLAITFCLADTNKPDFPTNILLRSYQKRQKYFVTFPNNLILVRSYTQKVMANNKCGPKQYTFNDTKVHLRPCCLYKRRALRDVQN